MNNFFKIVISQTLVSICMSTGQAQWVGVGPEVGKINALSVLGSYIFAGSWGGGVFRSTNNGSNWQFSGLAGQYVTRFTVKNSNLFAGAIGGSSLYLSTDFGASWQTRSTPLLNGISALTEKGDFLFAGALHAFGTQPKIVRSTDDGLSWVAADSGLTYGNFITFAVIGTNIFAAGFGGGVFRSTNSGSNWQAVNSGLPDSQIDQVAAIGTTLFATGTTNTWRSTDDGDSWQGTSFYPPGSSSPVTAFLDSGSVIYAGDLYGNIFRSTNAGSSWVQVGYTSPNLHALATNGAIMFAGTQNGGVYISANSGTTWQTVNTGLTDGYVNALAVTPSILFAAWDRGFNRGLARSTNQGTDWGSASNGLLTGASCLLANGSTLFAGSGTGAFISTDNGGSWLPTGSTGQYVKSLAISDSYLLAATNAGVLLSTNSGSTWQSLGLTKYSIDAIVASAPYVFATAGGRVYVSSDYDTIWTALDSTLVNGQSLAVSGSQVFVGTRGGVFLSSDQGLHWQFANQGFSSDNSVITFAVTGSGLFAGTDGRGVFVSANNGMNWRTVNFGLMNQKVASLISDGAYLFVGTWGNSVWRRPLSEMITSVDESEDLIAKQYMLSQNYPNPFNPSTTIKYELPRASHVSLTVYDVLGREVSLLVNERRDAGVHEVRFDGSNLASGVYFYRIHVGDFISVKKMLVLK